MQQSNSLRILEEILSTAIENGDVSKASGKILLDAMSFNNQPKNLISFYELLNKSLEDAKSIEKKNINRYINVIEALCDFFIVQHLWGVAWGIFANHINSKSVLNTLDALAEYFHSQNHEVLIEEDFLKELNDTFTDLLDEITESLLSEELKYFLTNQIEYITRAIRRYKIDGTKGLEKAIKSFIGDLVMVENNLNVNDKNNKAYKNTKAWAITLAIFLTPNLYDIIGSIPSLNDFWIPKFAHLITCQKEVNQIICESPNIQDTFEKASTIRDKQSQRNISASKELKSLPASEKVPSDSNDREKIIP
jgi:hypothetical protein